MVMELNDTGALLLGTKRIGAQIAMRLAAEGVNLAIGYRRSKDEAFRLQSEVDNYRSNNVEPGSSDGVRKTTVIQADLNVEEDVKRIIGESNEALGGLRFVINLASGYPRNPLDSLDSTAWDRAMTDAKSSYLVAVHASRLLEQNRGPSRGHIVMFGDWAAGETPYTDYLPYLTAKAAIQFMTRSFAAELASRGIQVNSIAPGPTMRPPEISEKSWQNNVLANTPLRRTSSVDDISELIVTLLRSETITGEIIRVDSGRHLAGPGV